MMSAMLEAARALAPDLRAAWPELDEVRRLPDALAQKFAKAGFYRMAVPKDLGGLELPPLDMAHAIEALAEADASAAWCVMIGATTGALAAYLPEKEARDIFTDPLAITSGVYAPMGKAERDGDTFVASGRWKWNSGGQTATWLVAGCMLFENGELQTFPNGAPQHRMMFVPASDVRFHDTWRTNGLKGTGSGDMSLEGARVPIVRSASLITDKPVRGGPLYKFPAFGHLALGIAAVAAGNAVAALDDFRDIATRKKTQGSSKTMAERQSIQALYAEHDARIHAARALFHTAIADTWSEAQGPDAISLEQRGRLRLASTHMARTAAESIRALQDYAGGEAVFADHALARRTRDAQTMTAHIMVAPATYELAGRTLFGLPTNAAEL